MTRVSGLVYTDVTSYWIQNELFDDPCYELPRNGLVDARSEPGHPPVPGTALTIWCGTEDDDVRVTVEVLGHAPATVEAGWEEVAEVSVDLPDDGGYVVTMADNEPPFDNTAPVLPPGPHRVRVHARGRDAGAENSGLYDGSVWEEHLIQAWPAPPAPQQVLRTGDQVGRERRETLNAATDTP